MHRKYCMSLSTELQWIKRKKFVKSQPCYKISATNRTFRKYSKSKNKRKVKNRTKFSSGTYSRHSSAENRKQEILFKNTYFREKDSINMDLQRIGELGFEKISVWYMLVLVLSFSFWWNSFIVAQCFVVFIYSTSQMAFDIDYGQLPYVVYVMDFIYTGEVTFNIAYRFNKGLKKLKFAGSRGIGYILVDIISLFPAEMMFKFHFYDNKKNDFIAGIFSQNRAVRIYRLFLLEREFMSSARNPWKYVLFTFIMFLAKIYIIAHVLSCLWHNIDNGAPCDEEKYFCYLWYVINMINVILMNWSGPKEMFSYDSEQKILVVALISSFILIYTYIYPYTFYFSVLSGCKDSTIAENNRRLRKYLHNMIQKSELRQRVARYFDYLWAEGEGDSELKDIMKSFPLSFQKDLYVDIYWEAFRHSDLLRDVSRNFKRSLSLFMMTEYYHDGEVIYYKGEEKRKMIFLVQGIIQVMAQENEKSPLLSFSSGTLFGELSLFLSTQSKAIVKCKGYCELQILNFRGILEVMVDYPKDRKLVFEKFKQRILMAQYTQWRKKKFKEEKRTEMLTMEPSYFTLVEVVKWLKMQWRFSWECQKRHLDVLKAKAEGTRLSSWRMPVKPEIKIEFISNYLDLIVLSNVLEEKKDLVCLKKVFPWSIAPSTQFLFIWKYTILGLSLMPPVMYPFCTSWYDRFPPPVYSLSYVITFFYIIDVCIKLFTAVVTKHDTITKFSEVIRINLQKPTFYCDIIAAIPYQAYILYNEWDVAKVEAYKIGLLLHPAICKAYIFIWWGASYMDIATFIKNCVMSILIIYILAELIQLYCIKDFFGHNDTWIDRYLNYSNEKSESEKQFMKENLISVFRAFVVAISIPSSSIYSDSNLDLVLTCILRYLFFVFFCYFIGSYYSSLLIKRFGTESFLILMGRLKNFLISKNISLKFVARIIKGIQFQWKYSRGDFIVNDVPIVQSMPNNIRREVILETTFKTLEMCPFFYGEPTEYLLEVLEHSDVVAVPSGLVLITYGHNSHILTILNRGYCQLNSHLIKDITANLGRPIIIGPGYAFPVLSSFTNTPTTVSVVTVSDCELIMIDLNKLITIMIKHNIFKDVVNVVEEEKLTEKLLHSRPALMKICTYRDGRITHSDSEIRELSWIRHCFYQFSKWVVSFLSSTFLIFWTYFYMFYLIFECFLWPSCFGLLVFQFHIIVPVLTGLKVIVIAHMAILSCFPFYNKKGLMVSHPFHTFLHYMSSSFTLDFIRFVPIFTIYLYGFCGPHQKPSITLTVLSNLQCLLGLTYIIGCIGHIGNVYGRNYHTRMVKIGTAFFLIINAYVNFCMFLFAEWTFGSPHKVVHFEVLKDFNPENLNVLRDNNPSDFYVFTSYWLFATMTTNHYSFRILGGLHRFLMYIHGFIGTLLGYFLYVNLSSASKFIKMGGAAYREEFSGLLKFLEYAKSEDKVVERVKIYYKYLWTKTGGENIKELFGQLPLCLLEELWYPLYRPTFVKNSIFDDANEGFFRILSTHVTSVYFTRGSVIIFKNEVQSYIYFLHRGKCFVYDWFMVLDLGSIVGDVNQSGLMQNKIYALTHVEMLKISSQLFFSIINNFSLLEANFKYMARKAESFLKSNTVRETHALRPFDSRDALNAFGLLNKEICFEDESHFEDPGNTTSEAYQSLTQKQGKQEKHHFIIYPLGWRMKIYSYLSVLDILVTILIVPWFFMFGGVSLMSFITFAVVDTFWLLVVIMTFFIGLVDHEKGDVITNHTYIAKRYLKTGFILDLISLVPFEAIPLLAAGSHVQNVIVSVLYLRLLRYCRVLSFYLYRDIEVGLLKSETGKKFILRVVSFIWIVIVVTAVFVSITNDPVVSRARDHLHTRAAQIDAGVRAFVYVLNLLISANVPTVTLTVKAELVHFNFSVIIFFFFKGWLISGVLSLMYHKNLSTFNYKTRVNKLEEYLMKKDTSPILIRSAVGYDTNLFKFNHCENLSSVLMRIPMNLRMLIMKDLYIHHMANFPLFLGLEDTFLEQLIARAKREVFFPGEKIVEQGDVDHRFYFIHTGEIYVINQTKQRAYTEYVVGRMFAGQYFGEAQGLWIPKPHVYTYRGRTVVEILSLFSDDWMDLRRAFPDISQLVLERARSLRFVD